MINVVRFRVVGDPAPQGSKKAIPVNGKARLVESAGIRHATWRNQVTAAATEAANQLDAPLDGALWLSIAFRFRMPTSRPAALRRRGVAWKTTTPDLSKLVRAVEDGLQAAGLITDDARICTTITSKIEAVDGWTGAEITVRHAPDLITEPGTGPITRIVAPGPDGETWNRNGT